MKILFVHDHLIRGGAAKAALRMRRLCQELGHETWSLHGDEAVLPGLPSFCAHGKPRGFGRLWEKLLPMKKRATLRKKRAEARFLRIRKSRKFDLVWFQNMAGAAKWGWSEAWIRDCLREGRVMITLHDMDYLGVGAPYVWDRPIRGTSFAGLPGSEVYAHIGSGKLRINACSLWLGNLCRDLYGVPCGRLPVPLWPEDFSPVSRNRLNARGVRLLVAADHLGDQRKNILPTLDLLVRHRILEKTHVEILCLGRDLPDRFQHPRIFRLGHLESPQKYRAVYDQIDFLLHPSLVDNFPLLIQESLAQGRPVVALRGGGVGEMVVEGKTGRLLASWDPESLEKVFGEISLQSEDGYRALSADCLHFATGQFHADTVSAGYREALQDWPYA